MQVKQVDHIHTPEFFNPAFDTGEFDLDNNPIITYALPVIKESKIDHISYRKASAHGEQELRIYLDQWEQLWDNGVLVAEQEVAAQIFEDGAWVEPVPVASVNAGENGDIVGTRDIFTKGIKLETTISWTAKHADPNAGKQVYTLTCAGKLGRVVWRIRIYDPSVTFDYSDYAGTTEYTLDEANVDYDLITVIFEPDGVMDGLVV